MIADGSELKLGYIVKMYPRISETFILNEMLELERRGAQISIFSLKKPNEGIFHPQVSGLKAKAHYLEGFDVKKWGTWLGELWDQIAADSDKIWELLKEGLAERDNYKLELVMNAAWIAARARELGITHFHAHFASLPSTMAYYAHLISGIPFSFTAHAKDIFVYDMEEHLLRKKLAAAKFVVTVTNYNYKYLTENAPEIDSSVIKVIHNGIDTDKFKPVEAEDRENNLILGVGRLVAKKGFATLLEACRRLKDKGVVYKCLLVGDGPERENLLVRKAELGLNDGEVELTGAKTLDEVLDLMRRATIFCLPCTVDSDGNQDALPTVIIEALALGLPVISTAISGIPEMIEHDKSGVLVEPDNPSELSRWMERLLGSRELRSGYAAAGRLLAERKFNLKNNVETMMRLYREDREFSAVSDN